MPFADEPSDIANGYFFYPLRVDEMGNDLGAGGAAWTGTWGNGTGFPDSDVKCNNWTSGSSSVSSRAGLPNAGSNAFAWWYTRSCSTTQSLYCFGIDNNVEVMPPQATGRIAFVSKGSWTPGGGIGTADALCQSEASNAGLSGSYRALLAGNGTTAASRFNTGGLPWRRPDGPAIAPTAAALFSAALHDVALYTAADLTAFFSNNGLWLGAGDPLTAGTSSSTCNNWTSSSSSLTITSGRTGRTDTSQLWSMSSSACDSTTGHLICLQE